MARFELNKNDYADFGKAFLEFYLENGFGNKSKTDIDTKIFSLIVPSDNNFALKKLALQLGITPQRFNNLCLQSTFRYGDNDEHKQKKELLKLLTQTKYGYDKNQDIIFLLSNPVLRVRFEAYCTGYQILYNTSFNKDIVSMSCQDFSNFLEKVFEDDIDSKKLKREHQIKGVVGNLIDCLPPYAQNMINLIDIRNFSVKMADYLMCMYDSFK